MGSRTLRLSLCVLFSMLLLASAYAGESPPQFILQWGSFGSGPDQFIAPYGIATTPSGDVYVCDQVNMRVSRFTADGGHLASWATECRGVTVDSQGRVLVTSDRVRRFTESGVLIDEIGGPGGGPGEFNTPYDVAVDASDNIYVVDHNLGRIQKFDGNGTFVVTIGNGHLVGPTSADFDIAGNLYVTDEALNRVSVFGPGGGLILEWGGPGAGDGQFNGPSGVAIGQIGDVYVADHQNFRVQKFSSDGTFLTKWGTFGVGPGEFDTAITLATGQDGIVYVVDGGNSRVQKFGLLPTPAEILSWGSVKARYRGERAPVTTDR